MINATRTYLPRLLSGRRFLMIYCIPYSVVSAHGILVSGDCLRISVFHSSVDSWSSCLRCCQCVEIHGSIQVASILCVHLHVASNSFIGVLSAWGQTVRLCICVWWSVYLLVSSVHGATQFDCAFACGEQFIYWCCQCMGPHSSIVCASMECAFSCGW